jgi:hypothetical protein
MAQSRIPIEAQKMHGQSPPPPAPSPAAAPAVAPGPRELFETLKTNLKNGGSLPKNLDEMDDPARGSIQKDMCALLAENPISSFAMWAVQSDWFKDSDATVSARRKLAAITSSTRVDLSVVAAAKAEAAAAKAEAMDAKIQAVKAEREALQVKEDAVLQIQIANAEAELKASEADTAKQHAHEAKTNAIEHQEQRKKIETELADMKIISAGSTVSLASTISLASTNALSSMGRPGSPSHILSASAADSVATGDGSTDGVLKLQHDLQHEKALYQASIEEYGERLQKHLEKERDFVRIVQAADSVTHALQDVHSEVVRSELEHDAIGAVAKQRSAGLQRELYGAMCQLDQVSDMHHHAKVREAYLRCELGQAAATVANVADVNTILTNELARSQTEVATNVEELQMRVEEWKHRANEAEAVLRHPAMCPLMNADRDLPTLLSKLDKISELNTEVEDLHRRQRIHSEEIDERSKQGRVAYLDADSEGKECSMPELVHTAIDIGTQESHRVEREIALVGKEADSVTFTQPGPLGIKFRRTSAGEIAVATVTAESQAAASNKLHSGSQLESVQSGSLKLDSVHSMAYSGVHSLLRCSSRPLTLTFRDAAALRPGMAERDGATAVVTLRQQGALGIRFRNNSGRGVIVSSVATGSQAAACSELKEGLRLVTMQLADGRSYSVATLPYRDVLKLLRLPSRPLILRLKEGLSGVPSAPPRIYATQGVSATFTDIGTLGLKFKPFKPAGQMGAVLSAINPGTQAVQHKQLTVGLVLLSIDSGGVRWGGFSAATFPEIIGLLREAGRPVTMQFGMDTLPTLPSLQHTDQPNASIDGVTSSVSEPLLPEPKSELEAGPVPSMLSPPSPAPAAMAHSTPKRTSTESSESRSPSRGRTIDVEAAPSISSPPSPSPAAIAPSTPKRTFTESVESRSPSMSRTIDVTESAPRISNTSSTRVSVTASDYAPVPESASPIPRGKSTLNQLARIPSPRPNPTPRRPCAHPSPKPKLLYQEHQLGQSNETLGRPVLHALGDQHIAGELSIFTSREENHSDVAGLRSEWVGICSDALRYFQDGNVDLQRWVDGIELSSVAAMDNLQSASRQIDETMDALVAANLVRGRAQAHYLYAKGQLSAGFKKLCDIVQLKELSIGHAVETVELQYQKSGDELRISQISTRLSILRDVAIEIVADVRHWLEGPFLNGTWSGRALSGGAGFDECGQMVCLKLDSAIQNVEQTLYIRQPTLRNMNSPDRSQSIQDASIRTRNLASRLQPAGMPNRFVARVEKHTSRVATHQSSWLSNATSASGGELFGTAVFSTYFLCLDFAGFYVTLGLVGTANRAWPKAVLADADTTLADMVQQLQLRLQPAEPPSNGPVRSLTAYFGASSTGVASSLSRNVATVIPGGAQSNSRNRSLAGLLSTGAT